MVLRVQIQVKEIPDSDVHGRYVLPFPGRYPYLHGPELTIEGRTVKEGLEED